MRSDFKEKKDRLLTFVGSSRKDRITSAFKKIGSSACQHCRRTRNDKHLCIFFVYARALTCCVVKHKTKYCMTHRLLLNTSHKHTAEVREGKKEKENEKMSQFVF
jgi:hypothetical protein